MLQIRSHLEGQGRTSQCRQGRRMLGEWCESKAGKGRAERRSAGKGEECLAAAAGAAAPVAHFDQEGEDKIYVIDLTEKKSHLVKRGNIKKTGYERTRWVQAAPDSCTGYERTRWVQAAPDSRCRFRVP